MQLCISLIFLVIIYNISKQYFGVMLKKSKSVAETEII